MNSQAAFEPQHLPIACEIVRDLNGRAKVCRTDAGQLFVAKTETVADRIIVDSRLELMIRLRKAGFPCPELIEIDGVNYIHDAGKVTYFQQYIEFEHAHQRKSFDRRFLIDAVQLLCKFQFLASPIKDPFLAARFRPKFEQNLKRRLNEASSAGNSKCIALLHWIKDQLNLFDEKEFLPCHGSFRHHNLYYDVNDRLYLIDFFHGVDYAPRLFDLGVLLSHFARGSLLALSPSFGCRCHGKNARAWLSGAWKWGTYRPGLLKAVLDEYGFKGNKLNSLIACIYLSMIRGKEFHALALSPQLSVFIRLLSGIYKSDNHQLNLEGCTHR